MNLRYKGNTDFEESRYPIPSKNEWGVDIITRRFRGRMPLLEAFLATLVQGSVYGGCYLQTWQPDNDPIFPEVTLEYKGFLSGVPPAPDGENSVGTRTSQISCEITSESTAEAIKGKPLEAEETDTVTAQREVLYESPETTWRYIYNANPNGPKFSILNTTQGLTVLRSRIEARTGKHQAVYAGANAPAALVTALFMPPNIRCVSHQAKNIIGTPFWECADLVALELLGGN